MNENKEKLLKLVKALRVDFGKEDPSLLIEKLSDENVELLLATYRDVGKHQKAVSDIVRTLDPGSYEHISSEYEKKIEEAEDKYLNNLEKLQENKDMKLDSLEDEAEKKLEEKESLMETEINELEKAHDSLSDKFQDIINKKSPQ